MCSDIKAALRLWGLLLLPLLLILQSTAACKTHLKSASRLFSLARSFARLTSECGSVQRAPTHSGLFHPEHSVLMQTQVSLAKITKTWLRQDAWKYYQVSNSAHLLHRGNNICYSKSFIIFVTLHINLFTITLDTMSLTNHQICWCKM